MFEQKYRRELERMGPGAEQVEQALELLRRSRKRGQGGPLGRRVLVGVLASAAMVVTVAAATLLGAFDFLREQDEYAMLGQTEIYEKYARAVDLSAAAENGDILTVDRAAMDGTFCTIFYSVRFREPVLSPAELEKLQRDDIPDLWQTYDWTPSFALYAAGEEVSEEGYNNSFEPQAYLADANTLYGAWRVLLSRPLTEGETVLFQGTQYTQERLSTGGAAGVAWDLSISFEAHPIASEHITPGVTFERRLPDRRSPIEVLALDRSPLGTLLTLRQEKIPNYSGLEFVLRDGDTGAYIPFAEVFTSHFKDPEGYVDSLFELYGDVGGLKNLELIPVRGIGSTSPRQAVSIADLPAEAPANPDGGYTPASYAVGDGKLIVAMRPLGAVTGQYPRLANGVYFLDREGNELFQQVSVQKFKDRSDGTITVVCTPGEDSFRADVDKVEQIWYFVQQYELLPGQTVSIPLS